jgi:hypothetical protein
VEINDAVRVVEALVERFRVEQGWGAAEVHVLPSGDEQESIKVWIGFSDPVREPALGARKRALAEALRKASPELAEIHIEVRAESMAE